MLSSHAFCEENNTYNKSPLSLSLKAAVEIALQNNRSIQIQEKEISYAQAGILDAQSHFLPMASVGYDFSYNDVIITPSTFPISSSSKKDIRVYSGYRSDNKATMNASQIIYDGGASIANLKEARVQLNIEKETLRARKLEIEFEVKRLYYGLLLAYETLHIAQNLVDRAQAHYENVRDRYGQGTSSRFDVLQSKVEVSKLIPDLINAKNSIETIGADLKKVLYMDIRQPIQVRERLSYKPIDIDEENFLREAYMKNPQINLKLLGVDLNKWAIEFAKSGYYPNINANASYMYRSDDITNMFNPKHDTWSVGVGGSLLVFDGFSTKAKVDEAKARYSQAILSKQDIIEQVAVDIKTGCLDMQDAHAVILSQKDNLQEAKEALKISYIAYDNGVAINLDVIDSQVSLSQVEKNLAVGIYDYLIAKAFLDRTMGREYLSSKEEDNDKER